MESRHSQRKWNVLVLDDDETNLEILAKAAQDAGYDVKIFYSGKEALDYLCENPGSVDIALLDKMTPDVNGMDILKYIKNSKSLKHIPVILQTGDVGVAQMCESLENGAYYYLTKPFHPQVLTAVLHSAVNECVMHKELMEQLDANQAQITRFLQQGEFIIRTHAEARQLAAMLSQASDNSESVAIGLMELMSNAIEHGNLEIGYEKKCKCLWTHTWLQELAARTEAKEYRNRTVRVRITKTTDALDIVIMDQGNGFDWRNYATINNDSGKLGKHNGRGIARAMSLLNNVTYAGFGNEVHCAIKSSSQSFPAYQNGIRGAETARLG